MQESAVRKERRRKPPICPQCGYFDQVVPILYGLPEPELVERARRGEVALGGSAVGEYSPPWYCKGCLHKFDVQPIPAPARSS